MPYADAVQFLKKLIAEKHRLQSDVAKRSGLSEAQVSRILSMESIASGDALIALASALDTSPEVVLRLAKRLPPQPEADPLAEEGVHILYQLDEDNLQEALRQLRLRLAVQEEQGKYHAPSRKRSATAD